MRVKGFVAVCGILALMIGCGGGGDGGAVKEVVEETHDNGNKRKVVTYQGRDNMVRTVFYNQEGAMMSDQHFQNGKPHGERTIYFPDGSISQQTNFQDSVRHGTDRSWYEGAERQIKSEGEYAQGVPVGRHVAYFQNGQISSEVVYKDGKKDGEEVANFSSGKKRHVKNFVDGGLHGLEIEYYDDRDNRVKSEKTYENNVLNGPFKTFHPNGKAEQTGRYLKGRRYDTWEQFNTAGRRVARVIYDENGNVKEGSSF